VFGCWVGQEAQREVVCKKKQKDDGQKANESFSKKNQRAPQEKKIPPRFSKKKNPGLNEREKKKSASDTSTGRKKREFL